MNAVELAIYRHLSAPFRDLMDTFRERNEKATFDEALKWVGAVLVEEQKIMDRVIEEMTNHDQDDKNYVPLREFRDQIQGEIEDGV